MENKELKNIFSNLPDAKKKEAFKALFKGKNLKIERIVSKGQVTPEGIWLKEKTAEWVILLKGKAKLLFKNNKNTFILNPGDYIYIPRNTSHRVTWTHLKQKTVWLAVHL
jgi:cupin 2 domain-containing protein